MAKKVTPTKVDSYSRISGELYDLIYSYKDYPAEASKLTSVIDAHCKSGGKQLLEVACGTGSHMLELSKKYTVEGIDLSPQMVKAAKKKLPRSKIVVADMKDFDMGKTYDAVLCLFSSIGHLKSSAELNKTVANFARHTKAGGVVVIEPWISPDAYQDGYIATENRSNHKYTLSIMETMTRRGNQTTLSMNYMIGVGGRVEHLAEDHHLYMFSNDEFEQAFSRAGLSMHIYPDGLHGRGLIVGEKPKAKKAQAKIIQPLVKN